MKLPRMRPPSMVSRFTPAGADHFCCVRLHCEVCERLIKSFHSRAMVNFTHVNGEETTTDRKLVHLNGRCEKS